MAEESNPEASQELPDYLQKYFTDRPRPKRYRDLDDLPLTKAKLLDVDPHDMERFAALAKEIANQIELDLDHGHSVPGSEEDDFDAGLAPIAVLQAYVFAILSAIYIQLAVAEEH